ncbi:MAG: hypothetical protein ACPF83_12250, partial [Flavobacteriales bacterium]
MKYIFSLMLALAAPTLIQAQLVSVFHEVEYTGDGTIPGYPAGFTTYRIYASLADGTDALSAVFAANNDPLLMGSDSDTMWNTSFGGVTGSDINAAFVAFFPEIAYDSMVTIGRASSADPGGAITAVVADPVNAFADALGAAATSGVDLVLTDGTWYTSVDQVNAYGTGTDFRVLLGQVTCSGDVEYQLNIQLNDGGIGGNILQYVWNQDAVDSSQQFNSSLSYPPLVPGCVDSNACNYDATATIGDGSCIFPDGCTDPVACNYNAAAICNDGSCDFGLWYLPNNAGDGPVTQACDAPEGYYLAVQSCIENIIAADPYCVDANWDVICMRAYNCCLEINGCGDLNACNYDEFACWDDTLCTYGGCSDPFACNFDPDATCDDGSCLLPDGCTDSTACNFDPDATCDDGSCILPDGCTDSTACNYQPSADCDDGSCIFPGCTDSLACNYQPAAGCDNGSCTFPGCTDSLACNYDSAAGCNDGSCTYPGCTDSLACNYQPAAGCDDGSCTYPGCTDPASVNYNPTAGCDDGSCILTLGSMVIDDVADLMFAEQLYLEVFIEDGQDIYAAYGSLSFDPSLYAFVEGIPGP